MKTLTLFEAYEGAELNKEIARDCREFRYGIAVDDDIYALEWQRWDRLSTKLHRHIVRKLGGEERGKESFCWYCGYLYGNCPSNCKRIIREMK